MQTILINIMVMAVIGLGIGFQLTRLLLRLQKPRLPAKEHPMNVFLCKMVKLIGRGHRLAIRILLICPLGQIMQGLMLTIGLTDRVAAGYGEIYLKASGPRRIRTLYLPAKDR